MQKIRLFISQDLSVFSDCCQDQEELTFALCLVYSCEPQGRVISGSEERLTYTAGQNLHTSVLGIC